jgi:EAL domain-containing protein (putative c-di-GMP-specific phosphodiesterase class I)
LGLGTGAEGVEDPGQVGVLRDLGCRLAQGFLWSPPRPHAIATAMVGATLPAP